VTPLTIIEINNSNTLSLNPGQHVTGSSTGGIPLDIKEIATTSQGLGAYDLIFTWDPDVIQIGDFVRSADAQANRGFTLTSGAIDNVTGRLHIVGTTTGGNTGYSKNDLTLGYLDVIAVGNSGDTATLAVTANKLLDNDAREIAPRVYFNVTVIITSLQSITVTPSNPSVPLGLTRQFTATGSYADLSNQDVTNTVNWTSSNTGVATIDSHTGLATSVALGTTNITAAWGNVSGCTTLTVIPGTTVEVNDGNTITLGEYQSIASSGSTGIPVTVKNLPDLGAPSNGLAAFNFNFSWDPAVVRVDSVSPSLAATGAGWSIFPGTPNNTDGALNCAGFTTTYSTDNVVLVYLGITATGTSGNSTSINIFITSLGDKDGNPISATPVNAGVTIETGLKAETSVSQGLSSSVYEVVVLRSNINRIKLTSDDSTIDVPGGIGGYSATVTGAPSDTIHFLTVYGVPPYNNPSFDNVTGIFTVSAVASPTQANNTTVAEIVPVLTGNVTTSVTLTVAFQTISAAGQPGLNIHEEHSNIISLTRGDSHEGEGITIADSLTIKQYLVGQLRLNQINPLNAASVVHDESTGDKISIGDALFIEQYLVGQRDAYFR
jgi:uncharacterized protein YjdB